MFLLFCFPDNIGAAKDGILTIDNLVKRGQSLVNWCCMCWCDGESVDHLLLHYKLAYALWCEVFHVFGVLWVMPKTLNFLFIFCCLGELVW